MASFPATSSVALEWRGIVEGFYGPPWTHRERLDQLGFAARHGLNAYVLAPKDDPYHRQRWREPYPGAQLAEITELAAAAAASGIRFVAAIAPGLDLRPGDPDDLAVLERKASTLWDAGVRHFALLFDDIPGFHRDDGALGAAHGRVCAGFAERFGGPLLVCPADYAGTAASKYRDGLAAALPVDALITWSGPSVVSTEVTADDVYRAEDTYQRRVVLWDNVPVNDFDRSRAYLGPLRARPGASSLAGVLANPMIEAAASRITLATVAEYARDPAGYDPEAAVARALAGEAPEDIQRLGPLIRASGWPPDADTGAELLPAIQAALAGDDAAAAELRARLTPLATTPPHPPVGEVAREVAPWVQAGRDLAAAALGACDLLSGASGDAAAVRAALAQAEQHWPNVLRDALSPFVRTVLHRHCPPATDAAPRYALLVAGTVATAGEERLAALLRGQGLDVRGAAVAGELPVLVVVSRSASEEGAVRAAGLPCPLLAFFHLGALGLATSSGVLMREERVRIVQSDHPLAGGRDGWVPVYRGPAMARWGEPGPDATVVARSDEDDRPVIVHYPAGAALADGSPAPAARAALFPGRDLLAPWVVTPDGVALVDAAIRALLDEDGRTEGASSRPARGTPG